MKLSRALAAGLAWVALAGCSALENPVAGLLNTGRDGRTFNVATGEFEWPDDQPARRAQPRRTAGAPSSAVPGVPGDGRYFDPQKNRWIESEEPSGPRAKKPSAKRPVAAPVVAVTPAPARPFIRSPERATGIYNAATGKFEWSEVSRPR